MSRRELDRVYHMYTDLAALERRFPGDYPLMIERGAGAYLFDDRGRRLLDGSQHLGACPIGHGRAEMAEAMADQLRTFEYCSLDGGISHRGVHDLASRLAPIVPVDDPYFFFCSSGSEANEVAIKVARFTQAALGRPGKVKILARSGSYHGSSYGAMSATGDARLREPFSPLLPGIVRVAGPGPDDADSDDPAEAIARAIEWEGPNTVAALIAEPIAMFGSIKVPPIGYWDRVRDICDQHDVLLILDEVVNGFGRTGTMFGADHWSLRGDIVTMAKGLTSSYFPMGAAAVSGGVAAVLDEHPISVHSNTHSGHPVGCAAALASLDILEREELPRRTADLETVVRAAQATLAAEVAAVVGIAAVGLLSSVRFRLPNGAGPELLLELKHECLQRGLIIRGSTMGDEVGVIFYPPLVVDEDDVRGGFTTLGEGLHAVGVR